MDDYQILRQRLEALGFEIDPDTGVHCNYFWAQVGGVAPDGRRFYYRWKYGTAEVRVWEGDGPDWSAEPTAEEDLDEEPDAALTEASLLRLLAA